MFPEWTWVLALFIGAAIGSFLNVVIYRMPRGLSLSSPKHSFCPSCHHRLTVPDLVPLLSWLVLRGKCRHCSAPVSPRYLVVELITGSLWAAFWWQYLVVGWDPIRGFLLAVFASALVAAIFIDLRHYIIPDQVNAAMLFCGLAYNGALYASGSARATTWGIPSAVAGALTGTLAIWGIALLGRLLFQKDAMGHGDIKMARGIGAMLFPVATGISLALAVVLGAVIGIVQVVARSMAARREQASEEDGAIEDMPPESIGSLLLCGLGYVLCIDVIGLFVPKLYEAWFKENPFAVEDVEDEPGVSLTMIPFGPYLALGALLTALFEPRLIAWVADYLKYATGDAL